MLVNTAERLVSVYWLHKSGLPMSFCTTGVRPHVVNDTFLRNMDLLSAIGPCNAVARKMSVHPHVTTHESRHDKKQTVERAV